MADISVVQNTYPTTPSVIAAQKSQEVIAFRELYSALPNSIQDCLLGKTQQQVTQNIDSQPWELKNQQFLKWMHAVETVFNTMFL